MPYLHPYFVLGGLDVVAEVPKDCLDVIIVNCKVNCYRLIQV